MLRFNIRSLMIATLFAAMFSTILLHYLRTKASKYTTYTPTLLARTLDDGQCAVVTIYAQWDTNTTDALRWLSPDVRRRIRDSGIFAMEADWTNLAPDITYLMKQYSLKTVPAVLFYSPKNRDHPIVMLDRLDESAVLAAINKCCNSRD